MPWLLIRIVRRPIPSRAAVSTSMPTIPNAASPMKFTQSLSGAASFAPIISP